MNLILTILLLSHKKGIENLLKATNNSFAAVNTCDINKISLCSWHLYITLLWYGVDSAPLYSLINYSEFEHRFKGQVIE